VSRLPPLRLLLLAVLLATAGCASAFGPALRYPEFKAQAAGLEPMSGIVDVSLVLQPLDNWRPWVVDVPQGRAPGAALSDRLGAGLRARGYPVARAALASQGGSLGLDPRRHEFYAVRRDAADSEDSRDGLSTEREPFFVEPDFAARSDARASLLTLYRALQANRDAPGSACAVPRGVVQALVAPDDRALVVLQIAAARGTQARIIESALMRSAERLTGRPPPRVPPKFELRLENYPEILLLSVVETAGGRILWSDGHAAEGSGFTAESLERALDTLLSRLPSRS
jgi:hypothetical protein